MGSLLGPGKEGAVGPCESGGRLECCSTWWRVLCSETSEGRHKTTATSAKRQREYFPAVGGARSTIISIRRHFAAVSKRIAASGNDPLSCPLRDGKQALEGR